MTVIYLMVSTRPGLLVSVGTHIFHFTVYLPGARFFRSSVSMTVLSSRNCVFPETIAPDIKNCYHRKDRFNGIGKG